MAVTHEDCDATTLKLIGEIKKKNHIPLAENKLKIDAQFWIGKDEEPAVKVSGRETFGRILIYKPHERAHGSPDALIMLDKAKWAAASIDEQEAQIDELLHSVEIRMTSGENPEPIRDGNGKLKLKRRKPDLFLCGFSEIAQRHGRNSPEHQTVRAMRDTFSQLHLFDNGSDAKQLEKSAA